MNIETVDGEVTMLGVKQPDGSRVFFLSASQLKEAEEILRELDFEYDSDGDEITGADEVNDRLFHLLHGWLFDVYPAEKKFNIELSLQVKARDEVEARKQVERELSRTNLLVDIDSVQED